MNHLERFRIARSTKLFSNLLRISKASQHGMVWTSTPGNLRYSVTEALRSHKPSPNSAMVRAYLKLLHQGPQPETAVKRLEKCASALLRIDIQPYVRKGSGFVKDDLNKDKLKDLMAVFVQYHAKLDPKELARAKKDQPFPSMWNYFKRITLRELGLIVPATTDNDVRHRVPMFDGASLMAAEKQGQWREKVFCVAPFAEEFEQWEDLEERETKRQRYVSSAMHEQSMGRPGNNRLHEMALPVDVGALTCIDAGSRAEWDSLNQFQSCLKNESINHELTSSVRAEAKQLMQKQGQGGPSHAQAAAMIHSPTSSEQVSINDVDPTQKSLCLHLQHWHTMYRSFKEEYKHNLPVPLTRKRVAKKQYFAGEEPCLLLGTAGTGKTTTLKAGNQALEKEGLQGRIVRGAYTGVAASNMGSGSRTMVSLLRLARKDRYTGVLLPLDEEGMTAMDEELGRMALLEIDEVSMLDKLFIAHLHQRLQEWRYAIYHPAYCTGSTCRCGASLPFGGIKLVLAGDFGQIPPVGVTPPKTLLCPNIIKQGANKSDVNLGSRLFRDIHVVFRLRRVHRQAGESVYKESLIRLRDAAHTKEDVALWKTHDLTDPSCNFTPEDRERLEKHSLHLFMENRRAGQRNGRRLGDHAVEHDAHILRIWSVESSPMVEKHKCDCYSQLRRVLHLVAEVPVMLIMNIRPAWGLVNGTRGILKSAKLLAREEHDEKSCDSVSLQSTPGTLARTRGRQRNAAEVGGVSAGDMDYLIIDFPGYTGPEQITDHPTYVVVYAQTARHEQYGQLSREQFPVVLAYGITVHKSQGITLESGDVVDFDHEPTWNPCGLLGLPFVGMSRSTDFSSQGFKHMPDYWAFREVADTDMFKWRRELEERLDALHDKTSAQIFNGANSADDDFDRHVLWTETRKGQPMSDSAKQDLKNMLFLRGMLNPPEYDDKPNRRGVALKLGGGRSKKNTMRPNKLSQLRSKSPSDPASSHDDSEGKPPSSTEINASDLEEVNALNAASSSWKDADLLAGLGVVSSKPAWFNHEDSGGIRDGVQMGLSCGYFAVRHALHPTHIGTLQSFEQGSQEDRMRYPLGDYDYSVLHTACNLAGFHVEPLIEGALLEASRIHDGPQGQGSHVQLFMPQYYNAVACLVHRPGHWVCIKATNSGDLLLCDSLYRHPFLLTSEEMSSFLTMIHSYLLQTTEEDAGEWCIFKVTRA